MCVCPGEKSRLLQDFGGKGKVVCSRERLYQAAKTTGVGFKVWVHVQLVETGSEDKVPELGKPEATEDSGALLW